MSPIKESIPMSGHGLQNLISQGDKNSLNYSHSAEISNTKGRLLNFKVISTALKTLQESYDQVDYQTKKNNILAPLTRHFFMTENMMTILVDSDLSHKHFGDQQAQARVLAVDYLTYLAECCDIKPLSQSVVILAKSLAKSGEQIKGQRFDLEELLAQDIINQDFEFKDIPRYLTSLGFENPYLFGADLSNSILAGVYFGLSKKYGEEATAHFFGSLKFNKNG